MAGGGDVRIAGASSRVKDGIANVTSHSLWVLVRGQPVQVEVTNMVTKAKLSAATTSRPINISSGSPSTIHEVPSGSTDAVFLYASNPNDDERIISLTLDGGTPVEKHVPPHESLLVLDGHLMLSEDTLSGQSDAGTIQVYGHVERQP